METTFSQTKAGKGKILCVDDHESILRTLTLLLTNSGYETVLAHDGKDGLEKFRQHNGDFVAAVVDLRMPEMDGVELAREIRKVSKEIPLIALSAYISRGGKDSLLKECEDAGFNACTIKPFDVEPFLRTVKELVGNRAAPSEGKTGKRDEK